MLEKRQFNFNGRSKYTVQISEAAEILLTATTNTTSSFVFEKYRKHCLIWNPLSLSFVDNQIIFLGKHPLHDTAKFGTLNIRMGISQLILYFQVVAAAVFIPAEEIEN